MTNVNCSRLESGRYLCDIYIVSFHNLNITDEFLLDKESKIVFYQSFGFGICTMYDMLMFAKEFIEELNF